MNIFTLREFKDWRSRALKKENEIPFTWKESRRGVYRQFEPLVVHGECDDDDDDILSVEGMSIAAFYTELYWNGLVNDWKLCKRFYREDEDLFHSYVGVKAKQLAAEPTSRNNVKHCPNNCMTLWQYTNGSLSVYSRSSDLRRAGLTDCVCVSNIAERLGAKTWHWINMQPHDYQNTTEIARRKCE
jgi:hypothetical protein